MHVLVRVVYVEYIMLGQIEDFFLITVIMNIFTHYGYLIFVDLKILKSANELYIQTESVLIIGGQIKDNLINQ